MFGSGRDIVVVFTSEAQFSAVTLVYDVPELFGGERLQNKKTQKNSRSGDKFKRMIC